MELVAVGGIVGHPLAGVQERHGQLFERLLRMLVEQPHRLARVEHRPAADGDQDIGLDPLQQRHSALDGLLVGLRSDLGEGVHVPGGQLAAQHLHHPTLVGEVVGDDHHCLAIQFAQIVQRAGVEERVGRHPEPLRRSPALRDGLDVEQLAVVDVLGRARPAPGSAAQRERRGQIVVDAAECADRGRRVDQDAAGAHRQRIGVDHRLVVAVDRRGVPQPAVLGHQHRGVDRGLHIGGAHQAQHRHQLLLHQWVLGEFVEIRGQRREQDLGAGRNAETRAGGQLRRLLADGVHRHLVATAEGELGDLGGLLRAEHPGAHPLELGDHLVVDLVVNDAGLLGGADHRGVKGFRDQDVDDRTPDVGGLVDVDRGVARPDAQRRLTGLVGQFDDLRSAGDPDEVDFGVVEQVVGDVVRGVRDHLQRAGRHAGRLGRLPQDLHRAFAAPNRVRRGAEQHRVAGLGGHDRLEQHRRGGVGDRGERQHHTDGLGDVDDVVLDILVDHADRLLVAQVVVEELGGHVVLDDLVLEDPEAGLLDRQAGQFPGGAHPGADHRLDDPVHLLLVELAELARRLGRGVDHRVDLRGADVIGRNLCCVQRPGHDHALPVLRGSYVWAGRGR